MKKRKLSGLEIAYLVFLLIIMIGASYLKNKGEPWYMIILNGAYGLGLSFLGSGLVFLVLFAAFYFAIKISAEMNDPISCNKKEKEMMDYGEKLIDPFYIVCFMISYIVCLIYL